MTKAQFLSNNSVTCEANHVKFETLIQDSSVHKSPKHLQKLVKGFAPANLYQNVEIFYFSGAV